MEANATGELVALSVEQLVLTDAFSENRLRWRNSPALNQPRVVLRRLTAVCRLLACHISNSRTVDRTFRVILVFDTHQNTPHARNFLVL